MERLRRLILSASALVAIWLYFFASLAPLVMIEQVDFAAKQQKSGPFGFRTEQESQLARLPLNHYIAEVTKGSLVQVTGSEWKALFRTAADVQAGGPIPEVIKGHVGPWDLKSHIGKHFFFRPDELPIRAVSSRLGQDNQRLYVGLAGNDPASYLSLTYKIYSNDDFSFGTGFNRIPDPPTRYLFPYRNIAPVVIAVGFILYFLMPRPKRNPAVIRYERWRIYLGDFAVLLLLIVPFFALPMKVIGGSVQALVLAWPITILMWPIAALGLWALKYMAWSAAYAIEVLDYGVKIYDDVATRELQFADMKNYQPAVFRPPQWLIFLSWVAALLGRGSSALGATGRALILSSTQCDGIAINTRSGRTVFVWATDQLGTSALAGFNRVLAALDEAHIPMKQEEFTVRSLVVVTEV
jgi:hypothetical protein